MMFLDRELNDGPPFIVAEIGASHNGYLYKACQLIKMASECGADAIKVQCYDADSMTIRSNRPEFIVQSPLWKGRHLWDLYEEAKTPLDWMPDLFETADKFEIPIFSSVFDQRGLRMLEELGCEAYKVASFEINDIPLIESIAKTRKPIVISTGMAETDDIIAALKVIPDEVGVVLLHCVSSYPCPPEESNLQRMVRFKDFGYPVGLSDHTNGILVPVAATALGMRMIEKHLTLDRNERGPDAEFSLEPSEFDLMSQAIRQAWKACQPSTSPSQQVNRTYRRSLYAVKPINAGDMFTEVNVRSIRPSSGLPPAMLPKVLGKVAARAIEEGTPLSLDMILTSS